MRRKGLTSTLRKLEYNGRHDAARILELRMQGLGYKMIAHEVGISRDAAREVVMRLERLIEERRRRGLPIEGVVGSSRSERVHG